MSASPRNSSTSSTPDRAGDFVVVAALLASVLAPGCASRQPLRYEPIVQIGHTTPAHDFRFSPDGRWLLTIASSGGSVPRVIQWDAETGDLVRSFPAAGFEFGPDGKSMLVLHRTGDRTIPTLISLATGAVLQRVRVGPDVPNFLQASLTTDGRYILMVWGQSVWSNELVEVALWDVAAGRNVWEPGLPLPFDAASDEWTTDFMESNAWLTERLRQDRRAVLFRRAIRPDGKVLATQTPLSGVAVTPNGKQILVRHWDDTGSSTDDTTLWDIESAEPLQRFYEPYDDDRPFHYGPDGTWFVRGIQHKTAAVCESVTGRMIREFEGHDALIRALALGPDGKTMLTGSRDGTVILWDVDSGGSLHTWREVGTASGRDGVVSVGYSPDGSQLLIGTAENTALLYDARTFAEVGVTAPPPQPGYEKLTAAFAPDGRHFLTLGRGGRGTEANAKLWDAASSRLVRDLSLPYTRPMAVSPDGRWAIAWRERNQGLALWDLTRARQVHRFDRHLSDWEARFSDCEPNAIHGRPGSHRMYGWLDKYDSGDMRIALPRDFGDQIPSIGELTPEAAEWLRGLTLETSLEWPRTTGPNQWRVLSPNGRYGAAWLPQDYDQPPTISLQRIAGGEQIRTLAFPDNAEGRYPTAAAFSPDGSQFVAAFASAERVAIVMMWDVETGQVGWRVENPLAQEHVDVGQFVFSPHGRYLAFGRQSRSPLVVVDAATGQKMMAAEGAVTFSGDGTFACFRGDTETLWQVPQGKMVAELSGHSSYSAFVFSPNGRFIWRNKSSGDFALVATETGQTVQTFGLLVAPFPGMVNYYDRIQFARQGTRFVTNTMQESWNEENTTSLWNFDSGEKICDLSLPGGERLPNVNVAPDDGKLFTFFQDPSLQVQRATGGKCQTGLIIWDAANGQQVATAKASLRWTSSPALRLQFTPAGDGCLTVHRDAVILWNLDSAAPSHVFREAAWSQLTTAFSPNGQRLLTVAPGQGATVWSLATGEKIQEYREQRQAHKGVAEDIWTTAAGFTQDGLNIMTVSHHGRGVHLMNIESGEHVRSFYLLGDDDQAVSLVPDVRSDGTSRSLIRYRQIGTNTLVTRWPGNASPE